MKKQNKENTEISTIPSWLYLLVGLTEITIAIIVAFWLLIVPGIVGLNGKLFITAILFVKGVALLAIGLAQFWAVQQ